MNGTQIIQSSAKKLNLGNKKRGVDKPPKLWYNQGTKKRYERGDNYDGIRYY